MTTLIPGIYSEYYISEEAPAGEKGLVGYAVISEAESEVMTFTSIEEAEDALEGNDSQIENCRIIFANGAEKIKYCCGTDIYKVLRKLCDEGVRFAASDTARAQDFANALFDLSDEEYHCIGFTDVSKEPEEMEAFLEYVCCYRLCALAGAPGACFAMAALASGAQDPAVPFNGAVLYGVTADRAYSKTELDTLLASGATPVKKYAAETCVVRAVTTNFYSPSWRDLNTIMIVDDVIPHIKSVLKARFQRAKNTEQTRQAVKTQTVIELEGKKEAGIIEGYGEVKVYKDEEDPALCRVDFSFRAASAMHIIKITACITV